MKSRLLNFLACPACGKGLELKVFLQDQEIKEGLLLCKSCQEWFPIINYVPRLLLPNFRNELFIPHPDYFKKYENSLPKTRGSFIQEDKVISIKKKTQNSFGYQWREFSEMYDEFKYHFLSFIDPPVKPQFFKSKIGLDMGCGFGRHLYFACIWGAEMIGIDLSEAVEPAYENTKHLENAHILQGDIYNLPFKKKIFDFVYSLGVLHHLPHPQDGFKKLTPLIKTGGAIFIWVYNKKKINTLTEMIRRMTSWMPYKPLYWFSFFVAGLEWIFILKPYALLNKLFKIEKILDFLPAHFKTYSLYPFRVSHADWFDRLSAPVRHYFDREELEDWYKEENLSNIQITPSKDYGWRVYGEKE